MDPETELPITFATPEVYEDDEETSAAPAPPAAIPDDLQKEIEELRTREADLAKQVRDNKAHADRLFQENRVASQMLAELYGSKEKAEDEAKAIQFVEPEAPPVEQLIQDPSLAVRYAREYGRSIADHTRKQVLLELKPFVGAAAQSQPILGQLTNRAQMAAIYEARAEIDESERAAFDEAVPKIAEIIKKNPQGIVHSLNPQAWIGGYRLTGGAAKPVKARSPQPQTVAPAAAPVPGATATSTARIPRYVAEMARRAGRDPREYYKRHLERTAR
jgi:hypothetical protein